MWNLNQLSPRVKIFDWKAKKLVWLRGVNRRVKHRLWKSSGSGLTSSVVDQFCWVIKICSQLFTNFRRHLSKAAATNLCTLATSGTHGSRPPASCSCLLGGSTTGSQLLTSGGSAWAAPDLRRLAMPAVTTTASTTATVVVRDCILILLQNKRFLSSQSKTEPIVTKIESTWLFGFGWPKLSTPKVLFCTLHDENP